MIKAGVVITFLSIATLYFVICDASSINSAGIRITINKANPSIPSNPSNTIVIDNSSIKYVDIVNDSDPLKNIATEWTIAIQPYEFKKAEEIIINNRLLDGEDVDMGSPEYIRKNKLKLCVGSGMVNIKIEGKNKTRILELDPGCDMPNYWPKGARKIYEYSYDLVNKYRAKIN